MPGERNTDHYVIMNENEMINFTDDTLQRDYLSFKES